MDETDEHVKEVYARFGLAIYCAQVLEHGIVNALIALDFIPTRRRTVRSTDEWNAAFDEFMSRHFETTMGRMMRDLRAVTTVHDDIDGLLREALRKRNFLAHDFFRERAEAFMNSSGRDKMIEEVDQCRDLFIAADKRLADAVAPIRRSHGLTDELVRKLFEEMTAEAEGAC